MRRIAFAALLVISAFVLAETAVGCTFGQALFNRSDGAALQVAERPGFAGELWFRAEGLGEIAGLHPYPVNCASPAYPCTLILPYDSDNKPVELSIGGASVTSNGEEAWPGPLDDTAPMFIWIYRLGFFYRECRLD